MILNMYIGLASKERNGHHLFSPLEEPWFWANFVKTWIQMGIDERDRMKVGALKI